MKKRFLKFIAMISAAIVLPCGTSAQTVFSAQVATNGQAAASDTLALTLSEALQIAKSQSLTVKIADKEVQKTGYAKNGSYSSLFPQINFSGAYQRTIKKQVMYMKMDTVTRSFAVGTANVYNMGFSASMPLINFPLWKSLEISGKSVDLAVEQARSSRQDLIDQVQQAFYTCLLASDSYDVYRENYNNTVHSYRDAKAKYESGRSAKYDMIRAEVTMQNAEPSMYDAQNSMVLAMWKLKALIGIDLNTNIKCIGKLSDYKDALRDVSFVADTTMLDRNSSLKQLDIQSYILSKTYKMQLAQYYPTLSASLSYSWIAMAEDFKFKDYNWNPYSVGGLSLTVPIFSGGQRWYNLKQTKVQQEELDLQRENTRRNLVVAVKQCLSSLETAVKQYSAAQASIEGAKTGYEIAQKRYEIGSGTLLEMNDAQLALLQAKLNLNQSIYTYLVAKSSLDKVLGVNVNDETEYNPQKRELIKKLPAAEMEHSKAADNWSEGNK